MSHHTSAMRADVVICGAGIAGISVAHALSVSHGVRHVVLVDAQSPLSLTSDKSTEAYRNWWPGPDDAMVRLINRSIDLLEQWADATDNRMLLNRRGYLYTTTRPERAVQFVEDAALATAQGAGPVRTYWSRGGPAPQCAAGPR
ncbi:MAG: FAD-dependent oxidoreductase, partial [Gemmatimonas sp.]